MSLSLPDVTLCAVTSINHELTVRAMNECLRHCSFADVVMVSSEPVNAPFRVEVIPPFTGWHYAPFICRNLTRYTASPFNLLVQYDGYIVNPEAWSDAFLHYDYIGAKWPWHPPGRRVGNSGFCLRSKRLLDILSEMPLPEAGTFVDDEFICHTHRQMLENKHDIKIAPEQIADMFAYERAAPTQPTFGFHGLFNMSRHMDDDQMREIPALIDDLYVTSRGYAEVLVQCFAAKKWDVLQGWYDRAREVVDAGHLKQNMREHFNDPAITDNLVAQCESRRGLPERAGYA